TTMPRVWIITGASSGFGLQLAKIAAAAGDTVIAASRNPSKLGGIPGVTPMRLDHNEPYPQVKADVDAMVALHGRVDILVNNAAYVQTGTLEETTADEALRQLQANVLGPLSVYRAVLPHMRSRRSGVLVTIGSMSGWAPFNACNLYGISKAAVRALGNGLAGEVEPFGIRHCLVEPGPFRTPLLDQGGNFAATEGTARIDDYRAMNEQTDATFRGMDGNQPGDPVKACQIIFDVVTREPAGDVPEYLPLGSMAVQVIRQCAEKVLAQLKEMEPLANSADL
ncbi:3-oxoacyl-reductase, partial [Microdochium trichocladiopsis]